MQRSESKAADDGAIPVAKAIYAALPLGTRPPVGGPFPILRWPLAYTPKSATPFCASAIRASRVRLYTCCELTCAGSGRHPIALFCAVSTCLSTFLAMRHLVLGTFGSTCLAHVCAHFAKCLRELTPSRHVRRRQSANLSAVDIERNAPRQCAHIFFRQAGGCTLPTCDRAVIASVDATLKLLMRHRTLHEAWRQK